MKRQPLPPVLARRDVLQTLGGAAALMLLLAPPSGRCDSPSGRSAIADAPQALSRIEFAALKAIVSRLIPADDASGGALEANAHTYIDRALSGAYAHHLPTYRASLAVLGEWMRRRAHGSIETWPPQDIDEWIAQIEARKAESPAGAPVLASAGRLFFDLVRRHTIEGMFCDPMYGGNREFLGWKMLGYPGVQLFYSFEAQELNSPRRFINRSASDYGGQPL